MSGYGPRSGEGCCGKCGVVSPWFDNGGGERGWRHVRRVLATCELVAEAPRVGCAEHGVTVAEFPGPATTVGPRPSRPGGLRRHRLVRLAAARRYGVSWRAVDHMCVALPPEALGRIDLLDGLVAIAIDEVKYKKGQRYLTVVCDHMTGGVIWPPRAGPRRPGEFFDLGDERAQNLSS